MKLESNGILISLRPFNERDSVAHIFTRDYGLVVGMMRGAVVARQNRPLVGQVGAMSWNARVDSQLGVFHWEAEKNLAAQLMTNPRCLGIVNAAFDLIVTLLPEHVAYTTLYDETLDLLSGIAPGDSFNEYLKWEINLLRELGYALDTTRCSGCGATENLNYISPKTGRAVCDKCAQPWRARLYKLPLNLNLTLRFLTAVCTAQGAKMPLSRQALYVE